MAIAMLSELVFICFFQPSLPALPETLPLAFPAWAVCTVSHRSVWLSVCLSPREIFLFCVSALTCCISSFFPPHLSRLSVSRRIPPCRVLVRRSTRHGQVDPHRERSDDKQRRSDRAKSAERRTPRRGSSGRSVQVPRRRSRRRHDFRRPLGGRAPRKCESLH